MFLRATETSKGTGLGLYIVKTSDKESLAKKFQNVTKISLKSD